MIVGPKDASREFHLHRAIISLNSTFFTAACKEGTFMEGSSRVVKLPEIQPNAFEQVVKWLYKGEYDLPGSEVKHEEFVAVLEAAEYLGIDALKNRMLSTLTERLEQQLGISPEHRTIAVPQELMHKICRVLTEKDWPTLRLIADYIYPAWRISWWYRNLEDDNSGAKDAVGLALHSADNFIGRSLCSLCMRELMLERPMKCINCNDRKPVMDSRCLDHPDFT